MRLTMKTRWELARDEAVRYRKASRKKCDSDSFREVSPFVKKIFQKV